MATNRVVEGVIGCVLILAPLVLWFVFYAVARWCPVDLRPTLLWIRTLRWITYAAGAAMFVIHLAGRNLFPLSYAMAVITFSAGLFLPEGWVKRRFASDRNIG